MRTARSHSPHFFLVGLRFLFAASEDHKSSQTQAISTNLDLCCPVKLILKRSSSLRKIDCPYNRRLCWILVDRIKFNIDEAAVSASALHYV